MNYWEECIHEAFDHAGIVATKEQIEIVWKVIDGAHENYGMAFGHDAIPDPVESEAKRKLVELQRKLDQQENFVLSTDPCRECTTTGAITDGWGRLQECALCRGKGRVPKRRRI